MNALNEIKYNTQGLIPVIVQQHDSSEVLMMAWMNNESIEKTLSEGYMHYWSRTRNKIWRKGETSNQTQKLIELRIDCDKDTLLAIVDQKGVACHTGTKSCFFRTFKNNELKRNQEVIISPKKLYNKTTK